jgi:hypothetical protein
MALIFFERVGHERRRPSPFSWRIRYALEHKQVDFEVRPVRFADVETIRALTGQHLTPVLSDGDHVVHETWHIACYLEERFPSKPSLFGGAIGRGMAQHINVWSDMQLGSALRRVIYGDFPAVLDAEDRAYFRATRERDLGMTLKLLVLIQRASWRPFNKLACHSNTRFRCSRTSAARHPLTRTIPYFRYSNGRGSAVQRKSWLKVPPLLNGEGE